MCKAKQMNVTGITRHVFLDSMLCAVSHVLNSLHRYSGTQWGWGTLCDLVDLDISPLSMGLDLIYSDLTPFKKAWGHVNWVAHYFIPLHKVNFKIHESGPKTYGMSQGEWVSSSPLQQPAHQNKSMYETNASCDSYTVGYRCVSSACWWISEDHIYMGMTLTHRAGSHVDWVIH